MRTSLILATLGALLLLSQPANSATSTVRSTVYGVLTGDNYGGCMVQIGRIPVDAGLDCPDKARTWVTLDCDGSFGTTEDSSNNLRMAQAALLAKTPISILIDDSYKVDGWCVGRQIIIRN
ncbi:hypothetical protein [uncultured Mediterranean phage uvMED]|nr:hypothetical protein [uncultured Mediterranean phage uvMED]